MSTENKPEESKNPQGAIQPGKILGLKPVYFYSILAAFVVLTSGLLYWYFNKKAKGATSLYGSNSNDSIARNFNTGHGYV